MKKYLYKVYDGSGNFLTTWKDVISEPSFSTELNGGFSEVNISLARGIFNYGEGEDVAYGNRVDVYCFDRDTTDEGVMIYSGFIASYEPTVEGRQETIDIMLSSYFWEMNRYLLEGNGTGIDSEIYGNGFESSKATSNMTNNTAPSPLVASASSTTSGYDAWKAFDGNKLDTTANPYASSTLPAWLKIDLGSGNEKVITKYTLTSRRSANLNQTMKSWIVQGSNDDSEWIDLDTQTNQVSWLEHEERSYTFDNDTAYRYYRIYVTEVNGSTLVAIQEFELFESVAFSRNGATSVKYLSQDPSDILKDVLDKFTAVGGTLDYDTGTVDTTGTTVSYTFNTNTVEEAVKKVVELCPEDWYVRIDPDNKVYLKEKPSTIDHKLFIGRNVVNYRQEKRLENIVNYIYFKGKNFFKKYSNTGSVSAYGRYTQKIIDERVTKVSTADTIANAILNKKNSPEIRIILKVLDNNSEQEKGYDIESLKVGDTVRIFNATKKGENKWDEIVWDEDDWDYDIVNEAGTALQIHKVEYYPDYAVLEISNRQPDINKRIEDINRNLVDSQTADNPVIPE